MKTTSTQSAVPTELIRLLIVDDHPLIHRGLATLIAQQDDIVIIGEACDGFEAIDQVYLLRPDVILLDLVLPRKDGLAVVQEIKQYEPEARIIILTSFGHDTRLIAAVQCGVLGVLRKDTMPQELLQAIRDVYRGEAHIDPDIDIEALLQAAASMEHRPPDEMFSRRERDVLRLVACGFPNADISRKLGMDERTVASHIRNMLKKMQFSNRTRLALYALRHGMVSLHESGTATSD
jgi:NarL family two-component system response regulator LiaR